MEHTPKWTDETIERDLRAMASLLGGVFPTAAQMRAMGRNDLACAVSKGGGFIHWSGRIGVSRVPSDSDFGWRGEDAFVELCREQGLEAHRVSGVKAPWDIEIQATLRVDVKTANRCTYGKGGGWHYRIAKKPQADVVVLYQADTGNFYGVPWWRCPSTNVTITDSGGKYADFRNDWPLIKRMLGLRMAEMADAAHAAVAEVA